MRINGIANNLYLKPDSASLIKKATDAYTSAYQAASKTDRIEISSEAYEACADNENLTATSGKDTLGITKGSKDGSFVIHFSDSAIVSRAVSRGYITVNGVEIQLTDDVKEQLMQVDKQAHADREQAFAQYIVQHDAAVAQQQSEAYKKAADEMSQALEIATKLSKGIKISPAESKLLMETNPQLYSISQMMATMGKRQHTQDEEPVQKPDRTQEPIQTAETSDHTPNIEWKSYDTRLAVSLTDTAQLQEVFEGEIDMNI